MFFLDPKAGKRGVLLNLVTCHVDESSVSAAEPRGNGSHVVLAADDSLLC